MEEFSLFDQFKERMTQLTDLRIARASHILVKKDDAAALEQLAEWKRQIGDDPDVFAELAREHSACPSRARGGDLGYFPRGKMARQPGSTASAHLPEMLAPGVPFATHETCPAGRRPPLPTRRITIPPLPYAGDGV